MPGKVGVKIKAGRNLPVMDRGSDTTDAYVEIKLGNTTHKTEVCRKSLNPQFNTDWFRFEVDDAELQDEPLQIRLMDHDTYSANDAIGKVNISLNPLCLDTNISGQTSHGKGTVLSGWIPVFDTMHGIRGEVNVIVKVDLFSDLNKFRQSSCGIPFFHSPCVPHGYRAQIIHGFVEELVVNDDPEYQWIDKIRTPRASNEARQSVFLQLSGQVQRKMGLKAINMGANAVIGYMQCFDLEGDVGVVVRGIGTAVTLIKDVSCSQQMTTATTTTTTATDNALIEERSKKYLQLLKNSSQTINYHRLQLSPMEALKSDLQKSRSTTALFDLKRDSSLDTEDDTAEMMLALMRQEDERGEKPVPKLKQQVRRFTRSSRNLFNEKYNAIKRKMGESIDSKSQDSISVRSFGSLVSGSGALGKSESSSSTRSSIYDGSQRRHSFKAKHKSSEKPKKSKYKQRHLQPTSSHAMMVRSISDDSAVKKHELQPPVPRIAVISEFQDNSRSSPDIFTTEKLDTTLLHASLPDDVPKTVENFGDEHESSSTTLSLTFSDSTTSTADETCVSGLSRLKLEPESMEMKQAKAQKLAQLLKIIDEEESGNERWIKPGQSSLDDDSLPELSRNRSYTSLLLNDLKAFSHTLQGLIKPKKSTPSTEKTTAMLRPKPPNNLLLSPLSAQNRKLYYSSQPEIFVEHAGAANELTVSTGCSLSPPSIAHSRSLVDLKLAATSKSDTRCAATTDDLPSSVQQPSSFKSYNLPPILQICPSTPTPTPSESDHSQVTPTEELLPPSIIIEEHRDSCTSQAASPCLAVDVDVNVDNVAFVVGGLKESASNTSIDTSVHCRIKSPLSTHDHDQKPFLPQKPQSLSSNASFKRIHNVQCLNEYNHINTIANTRHSKIDNKSLLAPSYSITSNTTTTTDTTTTTTTVATTSSSPHSAAPAITLNRHRHRNRSLHRSLNELNATNGGTTGLTESPSMKRFASPASAAIVAAASNATAAVTTATTNTTTAIPTNAVGSQLGSRSKLSPSPSKMVVGSSSNGTGGGESSINQTSQADSISSATTASTSTTTSATTMIPKDVGEICRRSSDSDLSVTPKGNSICVASERLVAATAMMRLSQPVSSKNSTGANTDSMDSMLEYPFLTMTKFPIGFILHLGATVAARSVKLLERVPNPDEPEVRDSWWTELRMEIRSHARALGCNVVLGYTESTTISDEVCVLSATGTAAVINMAYNRSVSQQDIYSTTTTSTKTSVGGGGGMSTSLEERDMAKETTRNGFGSSETKDAGGIISTSYGAAGLNAANLVGKKYAQLPAFNVAKATPSCTICHVPYNLTSVPFNVKMKKCSICRKGRVPDVLLATLEVPEFVQVTGRGSFMQAQVVRAKKDLRSELNAKEISDGLPFLEYELHRVLINKLKSRGMNAIFGLRTQVSIGERMIALIATGTALFLSALPVPQVPRIVAGNSWTDKQKLNELQKKLQETYERNQEIYQLKCMDPDMATTTFSSEVGKQQQSDTDESDDEVIEIDLNCGNKDTCVLEVDDIEDLEIISLLMEQYPPEGFHVVNTQIVPGMLDMEAVRNLQMFTQIWRAKLDVGQQTINGFPKHFQRILQSIYFKLRTMIPCAICDLRFRLDLPESDQIQLLVTGMALGLGDVSKFKYQQRRKQQQQLNSAGPSTNNLKLIAPNGNTTSPEINGTQPLTVNISGGSKRPLQEEDYIFPLDEDQMVETPTPTSNHPPYGTQSFKLRKTSPSRATSKINASLRNRYFPLRDRYGIDITPLTFIPGGRIDKYLGNLNFFFIRESTSIRENGGISGFVHSFITELLAVVRAHIAALGGNAMVSFYMNELILADNQHKNQGQCLISIGGDAVYVSYYTDE